MTVHLSPEIEALIQKRLETYSEEDDWMAENRDEISALIEQGWHEAQRGELIDGDTVRAEMGKLGEDWIRQHPSA